MPRTISKDNFTTEVLNSPKPVLVDFWAPWCGPCRMLSPVIDEVEEEMPGIKVCKINIDEQPELAKQYGVMSIPTLIVFKNGELTNSSVGVISKSEIVKLVNINE
ncbi:MAG: thioredoxin [Oscillospiraceae bacterium]|jgi:thioredoxin 1|nr:thioredoxin [Oscillospiraceae bacterium]